MMNRETLEAYAAGLIAKGWTPTRDDLTEFSQADVESPHNAFEIGQLDAIAKAARWVLESNLAKLGYVRIPGEAKAKSGKGGNLVLARKESGLREKAEKLGLNKKVEPEAAESAPKPAGSTQKDPHEMTREEHDKQHEKIVAAKKTLGRHYINRDARDWKSQGIHPSLAVVAHNIDGTIVGSDKLRKMVLHSAEKSGKQLGADQKAELKALTEQEDGEIEGWGITAGEYSSRLYDMLGIGDLKSKKKLSAKDKSDLADATKIHNNSRGAHRLVVEQALAAGKPVPPEVLADYPDLAKKADTPSEKAKDEEKPAARPPMVKGAPVLAYGKREGVLMIPDMGEIFGKYMGPIARVKFGESFLAKMEDVPVSNLQALHPHETEKGKAAAAAAEKAAAEAELNKKVHSELVATATKALDDAKSRGVNLHDQVKTKKARKNLMWQLSLATRIKNEAILSEAIDIALGTTK